jgi:hypothetical protein
MESRKASEDAQGQSRTCETTDDRTHWTGDHAAERCRAAQG